MLRCTDMRFIRESSLEEYANWYLERDAAKGDSRPIPNRPEQQVQAMRDRHRGKMRQWFNESTRWRIAELDVVEDLSNLVFLESDWTKKAALVIPDGPNYRLLRRVAENALRCEYLNTLPREHKHRIYYEGLETGTLRGAQRVAVCSAEPSEIQSNPDARYYLLDGVGRCLPYMMLLLDRKVEPMPVEAFLAERGTEARDPQKA
jgi:hypothetical protein